MNKKLIKTGYYVLFILLILILVFSILMIFNWFKDNKETRNITKKTKIEEKVYDKDTYIYKPSTNKLEELTKQNSDTVAYISVNLTDINYPVVQTNNNDYYLNYSFDKKKSQAGWVFMDYNNNKNFNDENTVIYAHNRIDKSMFGTLSNLLKADLTQEFPLIYISTLTQKYVYQIFSVYTIDVEDYYIKTSFKDNEKNEWLKTIQKRNIVKVNNSVNIEDKILTLSTCYNNNDTRLVVHAKKIM